MIHRNVWRAQKRYFQKLIDCRRKPDISLSQVFIHTFIEGDGDFDLLPVLAELRSCHGDFPVLRFCSGLTVVGCAGLKISWAVVQWITIVSTQY